MLSSLELGIHCAGLRFRDHEKSCNAAGSVRSCATVHGSGGLLAQRWAMKLRQFSAPPSKDEAELSIQAAHKAAWRQRKSTLYMRLRKLSPALFTRPTMPFAIGITSAIISRPPASTPPTRFVITGTPIGVGAESANPCRPHEGSY
jgi:hypothetical protein